MISGDIPVYTSGQRGRRRLHSTRAPFSQALGRNANTSFNSKNGPAQKLSHWKDGISRNARTKPTSRPLANVTPVG